MGSSVKRSLAVAAAGAVLVLAAACSGSPSMNSAGSGPVSAEAPARGAGGGAAPPPGGQGGNRSVVQTKAVIRTGEVVLTSKDTDAARARIDRLLSSLGGFVASEQTERAPDGTISRSTLVLRVPSTRFTAAVRALEAVGKVKRSDSQSRDVTTQVIDVGERVQTLQNSVNRLQRFQKRATDVNDLLRYEQEITDRQAQLQSLTAQRDYLAGETSMASITVYLSTPARYVAPPDALRHAGFLPGLRAGWHALADTVVVALTVVGAVLPFGVVLALLGVPVWLVLRRQLRERRAAVPGGGDGG